MTRSTTFAERLRRAVGTGRDGTASVRRTVARTVTPLAPAMSGAQDKGEAFARRLRAAIEQR